MKRSGDRIRTTHVGSLPRPAEVGELIRRRLHGEAVEDEMTAVLPHAVNEVVGAQIAGGVDSISDGELSKPGFTNYIRYRLDGTGGRTPIPDFHDLTEYFGRDFREVFPAELLLADTLPQAIGPLSYTGQAELQRDIGNFIAAGHANGADEMFMTSLSPGMLAFRMEDTYYGDYEQYLAALADVMSTEYELIVDAGLVLQLDCPDLAVVAPQTTTFWASDVVERMGFADFINLHIDALNHATRNIPEDRMRMHLCWANSPHSHLSDVPVRDVIPHVLKRARPHAISFEAANPRHAHEWREFEEIKVPDGKILIPGLIDTSTPFVEHPQLIAERLGRFIDLVGRENVIAGTDCGFGTVAGFTESSSGIPPHLVWEKLRALREGADLVSR